MVSHNNKWGPYFAPSLPCLYPPPHLLWGQRLEEGSLQTGCGHMTPICHLPSISPRELRARSENGGDRYSCSLALLVALCWMVPGGVPFPGYQPRPRVGSRGL